MYQAGLVLEGGGMKGFYTAGVLDLFLDKGLEFSSVYGVSAGACHMCSYLSKQRERARDVCLDYLDTSNYCGVKSLLTTGDLFNAKLCYELIPEYLNPYDYETYNQYKGKAYAVVTNIVTGRPEYLQVKDMKTDIQFVRASASLPLVSRNVKLGNGLYLDGGISDSIPIRKSIRDGNQKNIVIMTKEEGYIRKPASTANLALIKACYLKYPKVYELMKNRHTEYNQTLSCLSRRVQDGKAYVLRPSVKSDVGRIEKDEEKLMRLYREGYEDAQRHYEDILAYLEGQDTEKMQ